MNTILFVLVMMNPLTGQDVARVGFGTTDIERCQRAAVLHNAAGRMARCDVVFTTSIRY
jgi:hypothetical protein